ncbi:MAG: ThiF family adenylyltransferase [Planctomycetota bacterium]
MFQRYPDREWGTFFRFGFRRTSRGVSVYFIDALWPQAGDLDRQSDLTKFDALYAKRAFHTAARSDGLAIGVAHSHPVGCRTSPSLLDDDMDRYFGEELEAYGAGKPYCSLIFEHNTRGGLSFSGRLYDRGEWLAVTSLVTAGNHVARMQSQLAPLENEQVNCATTDRLASLMGDSSARRLRHSAVGVIGCSGTGSPAIEVLARAGVGEFILVDPDHLGESNLERVHGSQRRHVELSEKPLKVELMREMIHSINPHASVAAFAGNVLHANVIDHLVRTDVVLGCTDTAHGRVALDDLSRHHLVTCLDVGVLMNGKNGRVTDQVIDITMLSPGLPCLFCRGKVDAFKLSYELMPEREREEREKLAHDAAARGVEPDQYWQGKPRQLHTVGYLTTTAGALVAGYTEGILTGTFSPPHYDQQFDIAQQRFGFAAPPILARENCVCQKHLGWGEAALAFKNASLPRHWGQRAVQIAGAKVT